MAVIDFVNDVSKAIDDGMNTVGILWIYQKFWILLITAYC